MGKGKKEKRGGGGGRSGGVGGGGRGGGGGGGVGGGGGRQKRRTGGWCASEKTSLNSQLRELGLVSSNIAGDGNCLFATIAEQHLGSALKHPEVRALAISQMRLHAELYSPFMLEEDYEEMKVKDFEGFLGKMAQEREWGGNTELQALSNALGRSMVIHRAGERPFVLSPSLEEAAVLALKEPPLHLAYDGQHYDSVHQIAGAVVGIKAPPAGDAAAGGGGHAPAPMAEGGDLKVQALLQAFPALCLTAQQAQGALAASGGSLDDAIEALAVSAAAPASAAAAADLAPAAAQEGPAAQGVPEEGDCDPMPPSATLSVAGDKELKETEKEGGAGGVPAKATSKKGAKGGQCEREPPRNKACPCCSGKVYKKCCALKPRVAVGGGGGGGGAAAASPGKAPNLKGPPLGSPGSSFLAASFGGIDI